MATTKTLFLELFQPFAQYRNPFTFYYAQTFPLPPKSTIIGMLQNAVGEWYNEKYWDLKVSIHGGFESVFWNYQQFIKGDIKFQKVNNQLVSVNQERSLYGQGLKSQRSPLSQQELFNGHLWIFLRGEADMIDKIKNALEKPKKVLYLGRSEDIIFIKKLKVCEVDQITTSIAKKNIWLFEKPMYIKKEQFPIKNNKYPVYSISTNVFFKNNNRTISSKAELNKDTIREPKFETVIYTGTDYIIHLSNEIEIEDIILGELRFRIPTEYGWL